jgi:S1-C subfamily serine protease
VKSGLWVASVAFAIASGACGHRADYGGVAVTAAPLMRSLDREAMIRASTAAVAVVETDVGRGMAFVIDPAGYLITNRHVVEDGDHVESVVFPSRDPNRKFESVEVTYVDPVRDLALLRVHSDEPLPYLPLASQTSEPITRYLAKRDPVVLLARDPDPEHLDAGLLVRRGTVDRLSVFNPAAGPTPFVGVTSDVKQGQSGGPVLDRHGRAVAIVTWTWRDRPGGFAIPITEVNRMLAERPRFHDATQRRTRAWSRTRSFLDALVRDDFDTARRLTSPSHARKVREAAVDQVLAGDEVPEGLRWFVAAVEKIAENPPTTDDELRHSIAALDELVATTVGPEFRKALGAAGKLGDGQLKAFFRELGRAYLFARVFAAQSPPGALTAAVRRLQTVEAARSFAVEDVAQRLGRAEPEIESVKVVPGAYAPRAYAQIVVQREDAPPDRLTVQLKMEWGDWYVADVSRTALSERG